MCVDHCILLFKHLSNHAFYNKQLLTASAGHYQPFKHPHTTRSPPIGIVKLSEIFMYEG